MRVIFKPDARRDLQRHLKYLRQAGDPTVSHRLRAAIEGSAELLAHAPNAGTIVQHRKSELGVVRMFGVKGFREYMLFYRPIKDGIQVLRVIHAKRDYHRQLR